jgi:hypothetical protein
MIEFRPYKLLLMNPTPRKRCKNTCGTNNGQNNKNNLSALEKKRIVSF